MSILLTRGGNAALLPYLPRLASVRRNLTTVPVSAAAPPQDRRHRLDMCRGRLTPERYCVEGNGDEWNESVVVVMGATGTGKSKLSIDLATMFAGEVVNSDKIQVYRGLDITTNKMPVPERCGVPHHILGELDPAVGELRPEAFREMAARAIAGIAGRGLLPVLAGGSNSFIHAAMTGRYDPVRSPFEAGWRLLTRREARALRYRCCFLSVDVNAAVLAEQLDRRVEEMVAAGMVEELGRYFAAEAEAEAGESRHPGLGKAIGVAEFREYFRGEGRGTAAAYEDAVAAIKANTRRLAEEQVRKIERLVEMGWPLRRVDATAAVAARLAGEAAKAEAAWERDVAGPGATAVEQFLSEEVHVHHHHNIVSPPLLYT
ncbi:Adenylate isopentenyltransferase [Musa troglodytarum]|uniref:Adenylate isopentenyltransferase n=1 Tax=Musa troglodytarum TaxID=320322 RepID=A0A9E7FNH7_9LILI|nr:Adenylate isopentenyltransferase [Musa troglodytarum]